VAVLAGLILAAILGVVALVRRRGSSLVASRSKPNGPTPIGVSVPDGPCPQYPLDGGGRGAFCHLQVASLSGEGLTRCRSRLIRVAEARNRIWADDPRFTAPLRLKWAHAHPTDTHAEYRDIDPDSPALLDVVYSLDRSPGRAQIMTLDSGPIGLPTELGPGAYRLTVRVEAAKCPAADFTFLLVVTEMWPGVTLSPYIGSPATA
jgi:hypothetical protein